MNLDMIRYFLAVSRHLNFTRAAAECHIAQTAMSRQIKSMEDELGFQLFIRNNREVRLTEAGAIFAKEAGKILTRYQDAVDKARSVSKGFGGFLRIGFGQYEKDVLRSSVRRFREQYPEVRVVLEQYGYQRLARNLIDGNLDMIVSMKGCLRMLPPEHVFKVFREEPMVIISSPSHPLADRDRLEPQELSTLSFVYLEENTDPDAIEVYRQLCASYDFQPRRIVKVNSLDAKLVEVEDTDAVGIMPRFMAELLRERFHIYQFARDIGGKSQFCITYLKESQNRLVPLMYSFF